jgi:hypothetical protein
LALLADGTVRSWGNNNACQLGSGNVDTAYFATTPVMVQGLTGVVAIAAGFDHSLALLLDGTALAWGYGNEGELGNGVFQKNSCTPVPVSNLGGVVTISAGWYHTLALLADHTVRSWGYNAWGQLGDGTITDRATPVNVEPSGPVFTIGAGRGHSLAIVDPRYSVCLHYDPTKAVHSGTTIPIKLQLCDGSGNDLSSSTITVHAVSINLVSAAISGAVGDSGNSNPDNDFRFDPTLGSTGGYIFNLKTTGLPTGTYGLNFTVTGDSFVYAANFQVK